LSDELHSHLQVGLEDGLAQTFLRHTCVGIVGCRANLAVSLLECDGGLLIVADPIESVDAVGGAPWRHRRPPGVGD